MLTQLTVSAFKGLRRFSIKPQRVNLLIGANGTGKTNFADLIAFIASLGPQGLASTIQNFGDLAQIRTRQAGSNTPYKFQIEFQLGEDRSRGIQSVLYRFALAQAGEIKVQEEELKAILYRRKYGQFTKQGVPRFDYDQPVNLHYQREGGEITDWSEALGPSITEFDDERELVLAAYGRLGELRTLIDYLSSWRVYNLDAIMAKQAQGGSDKELDRYGANIVPFVARMLGDEKIRAKLLNDLREAVPYIQNVQPDRVLTFQTLRFLEQDTRAEFQLPEMSDGTIRLLGWLAMLRQPVPPAVVVIEEPENALHAYAIHHFLSVARRVAMNRDFPSQLFFTSHSPTVVDGLLSIEAMRETETQTACFITQRLPDAPSIVPAPAEVMQAIANNLGRPSDFQREGNFGDEPGRLPIPPEPQAVE
jgi:predicted ATPase